jgi:hypothetical protein
MGTDHGHGSDRERAELAKISFKFKRMAVRDRRLRTCRRRRQRRAVDAPERKYLRPRDECFGISWF